MRKILAVLLLCAGSVFSQGAAPTAPSPFDRTGNIIRSKVGTGNEFYFIVRQGAVYDTLFILESAVGARPTIEGRNWRMIGPFNNIFSDTVSVSTSGFIRLNSEYVSDFTGNRLQISGGQLTVVLTGDGVGSNEIDDQTIIRSDIDTTGTFVFGSAYITGSAVGDSIKQIMTKRYIDSTSIAGLPFSTWSSGQAQDKIPKLDTTGGLHLTWADDAGAAGGDNVTFDSTIAAGGSWTTTDVYLIADPDSGVSITRNGYGDSLFIKGTVANAVSVNGDTAASGKTWRWPDGYFTALNYVTADTINSSILYGTYFAVELTGIQSSFLYAGQSAGAANLSLASRSTGETRFYNDTNFTTINFRMDTDTLFGNAATKSAIKNIESIRTDTAIINGVTIASDASLADEQEISDSLAAVVRIANENVRDSGSAGDDWVIAGSGGTNAFHLKQQVVAGDDTSSIYNGDGTATGMGVVRIKGKSVQINGGTGSTVFGSAVQFNSTANHQGQNIDSVAHIDADTLVADAVLRLNGSVTATSYIGLKAPASPTTTVFTVPSADGTSGQALVTNGSGTLSFSTISGGTGGGFPLAVGTGAAGNTVDSAVIIGRSGVSATITKVTNVADSIILTASGLQPSNFATQDSIATNKEVAESLAVVYRQKFAVTSAYGTDSTWVNSGTNGVRLLNITAKHTGGDSTFITPDAGGGLVLGNATGNTYMAQDSVLFKKALYMGYGSKSRVDSAFIDSIRANEFGPGAGVAGDITAVGSMTTGDAFASGTADQDWLGLGATGGRVQFKAQGAGVADDAVLIPTGRFAVGRDTALIHKVEIIDSGAGAAGVLFYNPDTTSAGSYSYMTVKTHSKTDGTLGGDPTLTFQIEYGAGSQYRSWSMGVDNNTSDQFKLSYGDGIGSLAQRNIIVIDTTGWMQIDDTLYIGVHTADSLAATVGYVKKRIPYYNTAADIVWNYPTAAADTSMHCTFPYSSTYDTTYLAKVSTSTGADTAFGFVVPFYIQDSVTIDSFIIWALTSSATADSSKIDSVHFTWEGGDSSIVVVLTSNTTDRAGTGLTRYAMALSRSATPGEIIRARVVCALKEDESYVTIRKAQIKGSKRS